MTYLDSQFIKGNRALIFVSRLTLKEYFILFILELRIYSFTSYA